MLLFRPWRDIDDALRLWAGEAFGRGNIDEIWDAIFLNFLAWRRRILDTAWPYFRRHGPALTRPCFRHQPDIWWACITYPKLLSMELMLTQRTRSAAHKHVQILGLPIEEIEHDETKCAGDDEGDDADAASDPAGLDCDNDGTSTPPQVPPVTRAAYPPVVGIRCGALFSAHQLHEHMAKPCNLGRRSAESYYAEEFLSRTQSVSMDASSIHLSRDCVLPSGSATFLRDDWSAAALKAKAEMQKVYFEALDREDMNVHMSESTGILCKFMETRGAKKNHFHYLSI